MVWNESAASKGPQRNARRNVDVCCDICMIDRKVSMESGGGLRAELPPAALYAGGWSLYLDMARVGVREWETQEECGDVGFAIRQRTAFLHCAPKHCAGFERTATFLAWQWSSGGTWMTQEAK